MTEGTKWYDYNLPKKKKPYNDKIAGTQQTNLYKAKTTQHEKIINSKTKCTHQHNAV